MLVVAIAGVVFGLVVAFYASLLLPNSLGDGTNGTPVPLRVTQFAFACAVPIFAAIAARASVRVLRHTGGVRRPLLALLGCLLAFGGWVLTFFDWGSRFNL